MVHTTEKYLGTTGDGYRIYDREDSHLHFEGGLTRAIFQKALCWMIVRGAKFKKKEFYFNDQIGYAMCVPVTDEDEVVMVYRKGRRGPTPMVKGREPIPCNVLTVVVRRDMEYDNHYTLLTCFIGKGSKREPWDRGITNQEEKEACEKYWKTHALIYDEEQIDWNRM